MELFEECYRERSSELRPPFDLQLPLAAQEADAVDSLHGGRQVRHHVRVGGESRQAEGRQRREAAAQRALDGVGLGRLDVDARQALQAEGVLALQHLGAAEHVVELAEADGALQVRPGVRGAAGRGRGQAEVGGRDDDGHLAGEGRGGVRRRPGERNQAGLRPGPEDEARECRRVRGEASALARRGPVVRLHSAQNRHRAVARLDDGGRRRGGRQRGMMGNVVVAHR